VEASRSGGLGDRSVSRPERFDRPSAPIEHTATPVAAPELPRPGGLPSRSGESFRTSPVTGSAALSVPLPFSPGRGGAPDLAVGYDSSGRPGVFGYGWDLPVPRISRRTDRGLPRYRDESDVFMLADSEDLVPADAAPVLRTVAGAEYEVRRFMPRIEGAFTRIERWTNTADATDCKWRTITGDNATTWFGSDAASRIADPADPGRIFAWLAAFGHDDKGNAVAYEYAAEDGAGVDAGRACEAARSASDRTAGRYLKRVRYGNTVPHYPVLHPAEPVEPPGAWLFTLVLDYGDHDPLTPTVEPSRPWPVRPDPYSDRRAGFEQRTYRRCERALMFHDFPELGAEPTLVRSTDFTYDTEPVSGASRLVSIASTGHRRRGDGYERQSTPPLTPHYQAAEIDPTVRDVTAEQLPAGIHPPDSIWVDLDGDGVAGMLGRHRGAWYYTRNRSPLHDDRRTVEFGAAQVLPSSPALGRGSGDDALLLDLAGAGRPDLVRLTGPTPGFAGRDATGAWRGAEAFTRFPAVDFSTAEVVPADLTGDGLADLVVTDRAGTRWSRGLGTEGFAEAATIEEAEGAGAPSLVGVSATETVQLADMTGDGLSDLVRIGDGSVSYRPALGYGRFGPTVTMDDAPRFDGPDTFDPRRVLLADLDGNGRSDIVYLAAEGARLHANRGGDSWGPARVLPGVPGTDNRRYAAVVDLRGTGTACLVWSTRLPDDRTALRYVDLMSAGRPHLLTGYENGMGAEVRVEYRPSTHFMLADEQAGRPWPTRLPMPVSCAHRVVRVDRVRETAFTSLTSYHDGYYDPVEREFRGFGRVETTDTEAYELLPEAANTADADLHQPPVLTRTWHHTGAAAATGRRILHTRRSQYFENTALPEHELPEPDLPAGLTDEEYREACRALKGVMLRSEVYGLDDNDESTVPYTVAETAYGVKMIQPRGRNRHAVFQLTPAEAIGYGYDRRAADPRVSHSFVLEVDDMGLPLRSASVTYPRALDDPDLPATVRAAQARTHAAYTESDYTDDIERDDARRLRQPFETRSFELAGLPAGRLSAAQIEAAVSGAERVPYETVEADGTLAAPTGPVLRLLSRSRALFRSDDLAGPLPFGEHGLLGLAYRSKRMVFTDGLIAAHYDGSVTDAELTAAGYEHLDGGWWAASGTELYPTDAADHFYLPNGTVDPAGVATTVERDAHDLAVVTVTDHLGNQVHSEHDYRLLAPWAAVDAAGNRAETAFDVLGAPIASALVGKPGEPDMDSLADPTAAVEYDLFAWLDHRRPVWTRTSHRERHGPDNPSRQESYTYFDGAGSAVMSKGRAAPGPARQLDEATGTVVEVHADPRWIGNGRTVLNNKGLAVKQYEPYFSTTREFEPEAALVQVGVTSTPRYDPVGRAFRVDHPDGTFARTDNNPWRTVSHGPDDTVLDSAWYAERGSPDPTGPEPADPHERAAWLAARHADTPNITHLDALGRAALAIADNGGGDLRYSRSESDAAGGFSRVFDTRGRQIASGVANMTGGALAGDSAERGRRWALVDVIGRMVRTWDEHGRSLRSEYDELHRPVATFGTEGGEAEQVLARVFYGDDHPEAAERNLIGKPHMVFDSSGVGIVERYDSEGRALRTVARLVADHMTDPDWSLLAGIDDPALALALAEPMLEPVSEQIETSAVFDALGRAVSTTLADGTVIEPVYDEADRLAELRARIGGEGLPRTFMTGQEYDAMGRATLVRYGNATTAACTYDPLSLRLTELLTVADGDPGRPLQHLRYVHDVAGKIVEIGNEAQQTHFFNGSVAGPRQRFRYDALGQLVRAEGREHAGIPAGTPTGSGDAIGVPLPHPNDSVAVRPYAQEYEYDDLGNLTLLRHMASGAGWNRRYRYAHEVDPADLRNRLTATSVPSDDASGPYSHRYDHDVYGNMVATPNLAELRWDFADRLREVDLGGGGTAYYTYSSAGRVRKVVDRNGGLRTERRYLGAVEIYREWMNGTLRLERRTTHIAGEGGRFAQVDTKTVDPGGIDDAPLGEPVVRYQYGNHLGSATLEADESGAVISYEEYHPYGSTAYRSERPGTDLSLRRYRFHGKERDDETGLHYYGARYYASWLGRWISADPVGLSAGPNMYAYCSGDPVGRADPAGTKDACADQHGLPRTTTVQGFEEWARSAGVLYWGEPRYDAERHRWTVQGHSHTTPGEGGAIEAPSGGEAQAAEEEAPTFRATTAPEPEAEAGAAAGAQATPGAHAAGREAFQRNPSGPTLELPDNFDDAKFLAYTERIPDRGIGLRSAEPGHTSGGPSRTAGIRKANKGLANAFNEANGFLRSRTNQVDHVVELQHIIRRLHEFVRPQDHRYLNNRTNASQGSSAMHLDNAQRARGVQQDVPAGGVARTSEMGLLRNSERVRTALRRGGHALMAGGTALSFWGASQIEDPLVRVGAYATATGEAGASAAVVASRWALETNRFHSAANVARAGRVVRGARVFGGAAGGAGQALVSGYFAYEDYQSGDWTSFAFNACAAIGGVALVIGTVVGSPVLIGIGIGTGVAAAIYGVGHAFNAW
jgi:RHS repeat-associated protein